MGTSDSINSLERPRLGGRRQWLLLRGQRPDNPVLLFLHGLGMPAIPFAAFLRGLEPHFTVALWDQRGTGKTYSPFTSLSELDVETGISDCLELMALLRERFGQRKVVLAAHSSGSVLGLLAAARYPELLHAYVGIAQVVDAKEGFAEAARIGRERARAAGNARAEKELSDLSFLTSPKPERHRDCFARHLGWNLRLGGLAHEREAWARLRAAIVGCPEYGRLDLLKMKLGRRLLLGAALRQLGQANMLERVRRLDVPAFFAAGRHDSRSPLEHLERFVREAPNPRGHEIVHFERSAHLIVPEEPERFCELLVTRVLPLTRREPGLAAAG